MIEVRIVSRSAADDRRCCHGLSGALLEIAVDLLLGSHFSAERGIETRAYYTRPLYAEEAFARYASAGDDAGRSIAGTLVALPMFYGITEAQQRSVADAVRDASR